MPGRGGNATDGTPRVTEEHAGRRLFREHHGPRGDPVEVIGDTELGEFWPQMRPFFVNSAKNRPKVGENARDFVVCLSWPRQW